MLIVIFMKCEIKCGKKQCRRPKALIPGATWSFEANIQQTASDQANIQQTVSDHCGQHRRRYQGQLLRTSSSLGNSLPASMMQALQNLQSQLCYLY